MTTEPKKHGASQFVALEVSLEMIEVLREVVVIVRRHDPDLARQIVRSASSTAANLGESRGRQGKDRLHLFRIAAGSAEETRVHLRVALAWEWLKPADAETAFVRIDRVIAMLWRLTH